MLQRSKLLRTDGDGCGRVERHGVLRESALHRYLEKVARRAACHSVPTSASRVKMFAMDVSLVVNENNKTWLDILEFFRRVTSTRKLN